MLEPNLVVGVAPGKHKLGIQKVRARRKPNDKYIIVSINIIREATKDEYIEYHQRENIPYTLSQDDNYYAFYMD